MIANTLETINNHIKPDVTTNTDTVFEDMYIAVRSKEGRVYTDRQLAQLPAISTGHKYYKEWKLREKSARRLIAFLKKKKRPLKILEIGCGNGWLAAKLAGIPMSAVTGIDANSVEIDQARRVFKRPNLEFFHGKFNRDAFKDGQKFDVVIFAASIQYFPLLNNAIADAFSLMDSKGSIHIIDTPFYYQEDLPLAAERSYKYFISLGHPQMAANYFHHPLKTIMQFKYKVLYNPATLWNRLLNKGVFYWIKLKP